MYYMPYVRYMYIWWYKSLHALTTSFPWLSWSIQKINWTGAIRDTLQWTNISHFKVAKRSRWFFSSGFGCFCTNPRPPKVGSLDSWWSDSSVIGPVKIHGISGDFCTQNHKKHPIFDTFAIICEHLVKNPGMIGKRLVPFRWYPSCLTPQETFKRGYTEQIPTILRCIWGWLWRVSSQGYHLFPMKEVLKQFDFWDAFFCLAASQVASLSWLWRQAWQGFLMR